MGGHLWKTLSLAVAVASITACSESATDAAARSTDDAGPVVDARALAFSPSTESPGKIDLSCLDGRDLRNELRDHNGMAAIRDACSQEIDNAIGAWNLGQVERDAILATFVAYRFAPYGQSVAVTFDQLVREPALDCDNYAMFTGYLFRELQPDERLTYVGFDGGKIGNHAQAFVTKNGSSVLLDPTVGIVGQISFDDLLMGRRPVPSRVLIDSRAPEAAVALLHSNVLAAVTGGGYKPSDLLYYLRTIESMIAFSDHAGEFWNPDKYELLLLHYPTPGAEGLRRNLMGSP
jgi:hypothetical protein